MKKKLLFISFHFPPYNCIGAVRTGKTAKYLHEIGYDVRVISAKKQNLPKNLRLEIPKKFINYTEWIDLNKPLYKFFGNKKIDELKSLNQKFHFKGQIINSLKSIYQKFVHIPDSQIGWYPYAIKACNSLIATEWIPDLIFSSATPYTSHLVASKVAKEHSIPWYAEFRDLWTGNHYRSSSFIDYFIEKRTMNHAKALISVSEPLARKLSEIHTINSYTIKNGYDDEDFKFKVEKINHNSNKILIIHTGSLYLGKRDPTILFKALSSNAYLKKITNVEFYGPNLNWVNKLAIECGVSDIVSIKNPIPRNQVLRLQKQADLLLLITWDNPKEKGVYTGKFFEYIGSKTPILCIGATNDLPAQAINKYNFGISSNNTEDINNYLIRLKSKNIITSEKSRNKFNRRNQLMKLEKIFNLKEFT